MNFARALVNRHAIFATQIRAFSKPEWMLAAEAEAQARKGGSMRNNSTGFGAPEKYMVDKLTAEMKLESMGSTTQQEDRLRVAIQDLENLKK